MKRRVLAAVVATVYCAPAVDAWNVVSEANEHARRGVVCAQVGNLNCAEAELLRALALAPNDVSYLTSMGGILATGQKLDAANVYLEKAVRLDPRNVSARRNLAANQWQLGQLKSAQANLEHLLRQQPNDKVSMLLLGMVSENLHDYLSAAKFLSAVPELVQQRPESQAALANAWYHTRRRQQAHLALEKLLGQTDSPQGILAAAGVAAQAEDYELAAKLFESIRSRYPDTAVVEYNIALLQFRTGRFVESEKTLVNLVNTGRANGKAYNLLGKCYEREEKLSEAVRLFRKAIELEPGEEANYSDLVVVLTKSSRLATALEVAGKTVQAFPMSAPAYINRAVVQFKLNEFTDAVRSYNRALELDPKSLDARVGLASAKWAAGMRQEAETDFQTLLEQHPHSQSIYQSYGMALLTSADTDAMIERAGTLLRQAVDLDSSQAESHFQLGLLELKKNSSSTSPQSLQRGVAELETAARLGLNDSRIHFALARGFRRIGREADAAKEMQQYQGLKAAEANANTVQTTEANEAR